MRKMGKSIYAARDIKAGQTMTADDLHLRAPAIGDPPYMLDSYIGMYCPIDIEKGTPIAAGMFEVATAVEKMTGFMGE